MVASFDTRLLNGLNVLAAIAVAGDFVRAGERASSRWETAGSLAGGEYQGAIRFWNKEDQTNPGRRCRTSPIGTIQSSTFSFDAWCSNRGGSLRPGGTDDSSPAIYRRGP